MLESQKNGQNVKLSIILPVRNEAFNLRVMAKILLVSVDVPCELLVVYDFKEDETVPVVNDLERAYSNVHGIHNTLGVGVVNAIRAGMKVAKGECILIFATDEVGPVMAIEDMLELMNQGCDFISCTRYAHGGRRLGGSAIGGVLSRLANWLFHVIARSAFTDSTTGIKMFRRPIFDQLHLEAKPVGWAVAFEMALKAQLLGLKLGEVPVISVDRLYGGKSSFKLGPWLNEYLRWFLWGVPRLRGVTSGRQSNVVVRVPSLGGNKGKGQE